MTMVGDSIGLCPEAVCSSCRHFGSDYQGCDAFPNGIPTPILNGENDHQNPFLGDNDIQFERRQDET